MTVSRQDLSMTEHTSLQRHIVSQRCGQLPLIHNKMFPKRNVMHPATLSKSRLLAFRQCPKRLWLEIHRPEQRQNTVSVEKRFDSGKLIGNIACHLYDPQKKGQLIEPFKEGFAAALQRTTQLLDLSHPIFEAGFSAEGVLAFADIMLPVRRKGKRAWHMIEVKSSGKIHDYHRDDIAIQVFAACKAGIPLAAASLAHIDTKWVYPGNGDYQGLLTEIDLTEEAFGRNNEVKEWIAAAHAIAGKRTEPRLTTGSHCEKPYPCGFAAYCKGQEEQAQYPIQWLPGITNPAKKLKAWMALHKIADMRDLPDHLLNPTQLRVKTHTLSSKAYFNKAETASSLAAYKLPAYFLDFETIQFAAPIWKGTRPYQQIPFQFSLHRLTRTGKLEHHSFLSLDGKDPSKALAEALIAACGERGPIFSYNASFESARIGELAERFPRMKQGLLAIDARIIDLLPIARQHYYHPSQQGSWSIKKVLPALCPDLRYEDLEGIQNGGMAMDAYLELLSPQTSAARKTEIESQLKDYCALDTYAMVRLWSEFTGNYLRN